MCPRGERSIASLKGLATGDAIGKQTEGLDPCDGSCPRPLLSSLLAASGYDQDHVLRAESTGSSSSLP
jgi:hypothetical protein